MSQSSQNLKATSLMIASTVVLSLYLAAGCSYKVPKNGNLSAGAGGGAAGAVPAGAHLSFADVKARVFDQKCATCHIARTDGDLSLATYPSADQLTQIKTRVFEDAADPMPPSNKPPLTAEEANFLKAWLDAGAPEFAKEEPVTPSEPGTVNPPGPGVNPPGPGVPTDPGVTPPVAPYAHLSFAEMKAKVFDLKCQKCHIAGTDGDLSLLSQPNADQLMEMKKRVFEDPTDPMPPSDKPALTADEAALLKEWLDAGAPEMGVPTPGGPVPGGPVPGGPAPVVGFAEFQALNKDVFDGKCMKCHAPGKKKPSLSDFNEALKNKALIQERVFNTPNDPMPPASKPQLTAAEKAQLQSWLDLVK